MIHGPPGTGLMPCQRCVVEIDETFRRLPLCLSDINGFESMIARMPTPEERQRDGIAADAPVLVMRRGGKEQIYPAALVVLTIDTSPPAAPSPVRDAACYVIGEILEDLDNVRAKITDLYHAAQSPPSEIVRLADECRQQAADR